MSILEGNMDLPTFCRAWKIKILSVWGQVIFFGFFIFPVSRGVQLKGVAESSLLSKDEPLTPNIDKVMAV